jgi:NAD(P)-dependent dehydrogenase (short-subunit alcohol dehydrogenase family)
VQADLRSLDLLATWWDGLPPVSSIIHNASQYARDSLDSMTCDGLRDHMAVNFEAPMLLTQGFMRQLPVDASGSIIFLGDGYTGWTISPEFFTYALSKRAWDSAIDLLAAAVAPRARANAVALAPTLRNAWEDEALFTRLAARAPLKRTGALEEVYSAIDYLLASPGVTGQTISLANGMGLATKHG